MNDHPQLLHHPISKSPLTQHLELTMYYIHTLAKH